MLKMKAADVTDMLKLFWCSSKLTVFEGISKVLCKANIVHNETLNRWYAYRLLSTLDKMIETWTATYSRHPENHGLTVTIKELNKLRSICHEQMVKDGIA